MRCKAAQDRVLGNPKINVHWNTDVADIFGGEQPYGRLKIRNTKTGEESNLHVKGLF